MKNIYAISEDTEIIEYSDGEIHLAAKTYGSGRGVYIAGLPYSAENARLLIRAMYYAAHKEDTYHIWNTNNPKVEVHAYPEKGKYAIVNNVNEVQTAVVYTQDGQQMEVTLQPSEIRWGDMS